jgi:hypothetical protein
VSYKDTALTTELRASGAEGSRTLTIPLKRRKRYRYATTPSLDWGRICLRRVVRCMFVLLLKVVRGGVEPPPATYQIAVLPLQATEHGCPEGSRAQGGSRAAQTPLAISFDVTGSSRGGRSRTDFLVRPRHAGRRSPSFRFLSPRTWSELNGSDSPRLPPPPGADYAPREHTAPRPHDQ